MKKELADKLKRTYPMFFAPWPSSTNALPSLPDGAAIWCRDGWYEILETLCEYLVVQMEAGAPPLYFQEIKQKWGKLNIAAMGGNDDTRALLLSAESASLFVCEECGKPGRLMHACGIQVLCASCRQGGVPASPAVFHAVLHPLKVRWGRLSK